MEYNVMVPAYTEFEKTLQNERGFFKYMRLLENNKQNYLIVIAVGDTPAGALFTQNCAKAMMKALGLKIDMSGAYRQPYIAVIDGGEVIYEQTSADLEKPLTVDADLGEHKLFIYSGGFNCDDKFGSLAVFKFDDACYYGSRGFNFFTINTEKGYMVDGYHFETYEIEYLENFLWKSFLYVDKLISAIENNYSLFGGNPIFCLFSLPTFPLTGNRSEKENQLRATEFSLRCMVDDEKILQNIWNEKSLDICNYFNSIDDLREAISIPDSYEDIIGVLKFKDYKSNVVNIRNGHRITTNQPKEYKRSIFLVGLCTTFGVGADDSRTIASFLQRKLNEYISTEQFIVHNYGYFVGWMGTGIDKLLSVLSTLPTKKGDVVFLCYSDPIVHGLPFCDLFFKSKRPHDYGEIFFDMNHYTANGNKMIADGIFEFLERHDFFRNATMKITRQGEKPAPVESENNTKENELLTNYKNELIEFFKENIQPTVGAIVMNANPFTYGHRYLVEEALKQCDYLVVFVVEEDKSSIPFKDRFALVKENLADLPRVFVRRSGEFIISSKTFAEYFCKESIQEQKIDTTLDVTIFAKEIAPCLNISVRFAGKEPMDNITRQYNEDMEKILPQYGIKFVELPRKLTESGEIISASTVRELAKAKEFEKLKDFAPPATIEYLMKNI